ncbi:DegV family protein [Natranaerobius thermophilus]|uniref:DegV family protein n=1 Tax=Natranaerobius thermophilus (strain ATCC BAA-1301 / DSM 18059 / JW/NM-WN-LF) TaxID=457570 RepID=B2A8C2_NATTJ|nr:DegV family protein [Natranaerobius thermophilus]ACB84488.1 degV family protein [Natranaerobius thermophilus JW/NM-WN-LF]
MQKIGIVTDSTADIPENLREKHNIHVIPLSVVHGDTVYRDGVDIDSENFYELLENSDTIPQSSQPTPQDFENLYKNLLGKYEEIISVHLSAGLSGTINAAEQAGKLFQNRVHVFDSKGISAGIGLQVIEAAKKIQEGWETEKVMEFLGSLRNNVETLFTLDTLEYLHKGGRIGKVSSMLGSFLNIKPIVRVEDGKFVPYGKARSRRTALNKIVNNLETFAENRVPWKLAIAHGQGKEGADFLKEVLDEKFGIEADIYTTIGPVIGVHTGPGTSGAAVMFSPE